MPITPEQVRMLLSEHGQTCSEGLDDWSGKIELPNEIANFYRDIGPSNITIEGCGNPYFLPRLDILWDYQCGYRWDGNTGERLDDWLDQWLVVADEGADPFIFDQETGRILYAMHGMGVWEPEEVFPDIYTMAACLATLGSVVREMGSGFYDVDYNIQPQARQLAVKKLKLIVGSNADVELILTNLGWG